LSIQNFTHHLTVTVVPIFQTVAAVGSRIGGTKTSRTPASVLGATAVPLTRVVQARRRVAKDDLKSIALIVSFG
jgi:hypothetical protein